MNRTPIRDPRQRWIIAAMLAGAVVLGALGVLVSGLNRHTAPVAAGTHVTAPAKTKRSKTAPRKTKLYTGPGGVGSAPSLAAQSVPMPAPAPAHSAVAACQELVVELHTYNWRTPYLPASSLTTVATPALAAKLTTGAHMTPGQVSQHVDMTTQSAVQVDGKDILVAVRPGTLPIELWTCRATADASGNYLATTLVYGAPGEPGVPRA
jgi:hypothetical protein